MALFFGYRVNNEPGLPKECDLEEGIKVANCSLAHERDLSVGNFEKAICVRGVRI